MGGSSSKQREEERKRKEEEDRVRRAIEYARLQAERKRRDEEVMRQAMEYARRQAAIEREQERRRLELRRLAEEQRIRAKTVFLRRLQKHIVTRNLDLLNDFRKAFGLTLLSRYPYKPYTETELLKTSMNYIRASIVFKTSNKPCFTISKITSVDNTFHVLQYKLMKDKYQKCYGESSLSEKLMFHGTKREFLDSICTYNFDRSKVVNHKFGHGISFARDAFYATHYHRDNKQNYNKVMIITQMFWGGLDRGTEDMIVPRRPRYTSANAEKSVIVKYDDASYYPLYIVYYDGLHTASMNPGDVCCY